MTLLQVIVLIYISQFTHHDFFIHRSSLIYLVSFYIIDNVKRGFMGSAISVAASEIDVGAGGDGNKLSQNAATKQVFCSTAIV